MSELWNTGRPRRHLKHNMRVGQLTVTMVRNQTYVLLLIRESGGFCLDHVPLTSELFKSVREEPGPMGHGCVHQVFDELLLTSTSCPLQQTGQLVGGIGSPGSTTSALALPQPRSPSQTHHWFRIHPCCCSTLPYSALHCPMQRSPTRLRHHPQPRGSPLCPRISFKVRACMDARCPC